MKLNFTWKLQTGQYQNGENLYINKICVGSSFWNSTMSRYESAEYKKAHQYVGNCFLPGIISTQLCGATREAVRNTIERIVIEWFTEALK